MPLTESVTWLVTPPHAKESCYYYRVLRPGGEPHRAYLTYRLPRVGVPRRDLLMLKRDDRRTLSGLLDPRDRGRLDTLARELQAQRSSRSALTSQKSIVNRVYDDEAPIDNLVNAVHKLGPVPVYMLPDPVEITVLDHPAGPRTLAATIGVYQDVPVAISGGQWPRVMVDRVQFLTSLQRDLPTIFRRYFEDVAELLFDIQHHLSHREAIDACKLIRDIVSTSIGTKLREITEPGRYRSTQPEAARIAAALDRDYADTVLLAQSFSSFVLYLVNSLYRAFHLRDACAEYRQEIEKLRARRKLSETEDGGESTDLATLWSVIEASLDGEPKLTDISLGESEPSWLNRVVGFAHFVELFTQDEFVAARPTIFFSGQHRVPSSETLYRLLRDSVGDRIALTEVFEEVPGVDFPTLISNRIWQSEGIAAVIPVQREELGTVEQKGLAWVVREVDYADLLDKRVVPLLENGQTIDRILEEVAAEDIGPLVPSARRRPNRATPYDTFRFYLTQRLPAGYSQRSLRDIDQNLLADFQEETRRILNRRTWQLVNAIINYVAADKHEKMALRTIHFRTLNSGLMVEQLAPLVFPGIGGRQARKRFEHLRERIADRTVVWNGEEIRVVGLERGSRRYRTNFPRIVTALRPDLSEQEVTQLLRQTLRERAI